MLASVLSHTVNAYVDLPGSDVLSGHRYTNLISMVPAILLGLQTLFFVEADWNGTNL